MRPRWKVINDAVPVRESSEVIARELPERLPKGAVVEELQVVGDALYFKRISGSGPLSGWADVKDPYGKELLARVVAAAAPPAVKRKAPQEAAGTPARVLKTAEKAAGQPAPAEAKGREWEVVSEESVFAQKGQRPSSLKVTPALPNGTIVEEVVQVGDRLHFVNHSGMGPPTGWVSIKARGKELLRPVDGYLPEPELKSLDDAKADLFRMETLGGQDVPMSVAVPETTEVSNSEAPEAERNNPLGGWAAMSKVFHHPAEPKKAQEPAKVAGPPEMEEAKKKQDSWAALAKIHNQKSQAAVAAETAAQRRVLAAKEELPPVKDLMRLGAEELAKLLRLEPVIANQFVGLPILEKRRMIGERRAQIEGERLEAVEALQRVEEEKRRAQAEKEAAAAAAAKAAEAKALDEEGAPLAGWVSLLGLLCEGDEPEGGPMAAVAAETLKARRAARELPEVGDLEDLSAAALAELLGLDALAARELAALSVAMRKKVIAEAKALLELEPEKRLDFLEQYQKAWPRGPFPELTPPVDEHTLLPPGSCFPYSRHLSEVPVGPTAEWGLDSPAGRALRTYFRRRNTSHPEAQKEFLRSLTCDIQCTAKAVPADAGVAVQDPCRAGGSVDADQLAGTIVAKGAVRPDDALKYLNTELQKRICLLDGDIAARLAQEKLGETEYRGERFKNFKETDASGKPIQLAGNVAVLNLTKAGLVTEVHKEYLLAGADIIRTNTYECNSITQEGYAMHMLVYEMNKAAAQLAKKATAEVTKQEPSKPRFVAGVIGPSTSMLSLTPGASWAKLVEAYSEQVKGLVDGGADVLMLDGVADSLNAKAAVFAMDEHFRLLGRKRLPLLLSAQIAAGGRTPSGQSVDAFCISLRHARPLSLGLSPADGELKESSKALASLHLGWCSGCPSAEGKSPDQYATAALDSAREGVLNILGGGAGALPAHVAALAKRAKEGSPRKLPPVPERPVLQLAGLDACTVKPDGGFQVVGGQCSVIGSAKFKKKISGYKATGQKKFLREAMQVCVEQCDKGADILDFNLDSDMSSGVAAPAKGVLGAFLQLASAEPKVAKVPFMLCSSDWETIKDGLRHVQGKCVVNGLSLALGEQEFLRIAGECRAHGAALVVLPLTDSCDPAETQDDKVRICQRSYKLLRSRLDFPAEDIIFDCQILPLGLPEYASRASDFISAMEELKRTCPCASFVAGLNNLSLPFRGVNMVRDALHSVFLQHAIPRGLNMAIAWPGALPVYSDIDTETRVLCEEMVLNASADARHLERFAAFVNFHADTATCLPVRSPGLWVEAGRLAAAVRKEAQEMQKQLRAQRQASTPQQQKSALKALRCNVKCVAEPLQADAGAGLPDPCQQEGFVDKQQISASVVARSAVRPTELARYLNAELKKRILFLATPSSGVTSKADFKAYFDKGCDVLGTNTTTVTGYEDSKAAAQLVKEAAAEATKGDTSKPRLVAGVIGPSEHSLSSPSSAGDPSLRTTSWEELVASYTEQVRGLADGGVDLLSLEMVSDTLNAKAAIFAIDEFFSQAKRERPPLLVTAVIAESGKLPCGQSIEAFMVSIAHAKPLSVGVRGPPEPTKRAAEALSRLRAAAWCHVVADSKAAELSAYGDSGLVNFAGTRGLPAGDLEAVAKAVRSARPRTAPAKAAPVLRLAGLEAVEVATEGGGVQLVGQRCNLGGSAQFRGLVDAYKYNRQGSRWEAALEVCVEQIEGGAEILDLNFDSELIDSKWAMGKFLRLCSAEARVARVPFILGSAEWPAIEAGLRSIQGKSAVNAISFLQGEEEFLRLAAACRRYGAAVVVMALDSPEEGASFQDRVSIGQRAYSLLRKRLDFPPEDIIFDCHVVPMDQPGAARDFIDAIGELKRTCPHVSFIGGVGNLSLPYRGAPALREALHSIFLCQAVPAGLNLAIVDVGKLPRKGDIEANTKRICEEAIQNDSEDGKHSERLELYGAYLSGGAAAADLAVPGLPSHQAAAIVRKDGTKMFTQPVRTLVQATGTITTSIFQNFASKAHAALNFHRNNAGIELKRQVWYSSISAWMGQGGTGPIAAASLVMDGSALKERWMGYQNQSCAVEWGAVGEIGLRRTLYGSRDVFAQFDLGQKLVSPENAQFLMRAVCCLPADPYEVIALAFLDQTWQMTLAGLATGSGLDRKTFAEV